MPGSPIQPLPSLQCIVEFPGKAILGGPILLRFSLRNSGDADLRVLKRNLPLDGIEGPFAVIEGGAGSVPYAGITVVRGEPAPEEYVLIPAGKTVSTTVDLADVYAFPAPGDYRVRIETHTVVLAGDAPQDRAEHELRRPVPLTSQEAILTLVAGEAPARGQVLQDTEPSLARAPVAQPTVALGASSNRPQPIPPPRVVNGTSAQQEHVARAHEGVNVFLWGALQSLRSHDQGGPNYVTWFGTFSQARFDTVVSNFQRLYDWVGHQPFTYDLGGPRCQERSYAYWSGTDVTTIYLCPLFHTFPFSGEDSMIGFLINILGRALGVTQPWPSDREYCKSVAQDNPNFAVRDAGNNQYFAETTLPFDYGKDASAVLPNKLTYVTLGPLYVRYSDDDASTIDPSYPRPIQENWGNLPDAFKQGFDAMAVLPNGKLYVIKGNEYIRYSDPNAYTVDEGYPLPLQGRWGKLPPPFDQGFDTVQTLPNGKIYVTKGSEYIRYSDQNASTVDEGYPMPLQGPWGTLPPDFAQGFDCVLVSREKRIYVVKGRRYIRYSDGDASSIDPGYPLPVEGHWGKMP